MKWYAKGILAIVLTTLVGGCGLMEPRSFSDDDEISVSNTDVSKKNTSRGLGNTEIGSRNKKGLLPNGGGNGGGSGSNLSSNNRSQSSSTPTSPNPPQDPPGGGERDRNDQPPRRNVVHHNNQPQQRPEVQQQQQRLRQQAEDRRRREQERQDGELVRQLQQQLQQQQPVNNNPNNNDNLQQVNNDPNNQRQDPPQRVEGDEAGGIIDDQNLEFRNIEREQRQIEQQRRENEVVMQQEQEQERQEERNAQIVAFMVKAAQGVFIKYPQLQNSLRNLPQTYQGFEVRMRNDRSLQEFVFRLNSIFGENTLLILETSYNQLNFLTIDELAKQIANECLQGNLCNTQADKLHFVTAVLRLNNGRPENNNFLGWLDVIGDQENNEPRRNVMVGTILHRFRDVTGGVVEPAQLVQFLQALDPTVAYTFLNAKAQDFYTNWQHESKAHIPQAQTVLKGQPDNYIQFDRHGAVQRLNQFLSNEEPNDGWVNNFNNNRIEGQQQRLQQYLGAFNAFVNAFVVHLGNQISVDHARFFYTGVLLR